ncbi:hypothetical protein HPB52_001132 [Rhipicephalus sanguineus]|uniref:Uncharacterized protein n=1 Tax=Rhipicephalus sanguineus TaxID=34632 RepID=A0A9D4SNC4_RHISA|nr:hypothetical protein HPB52_001132 [Rhipicephalus sanguineus]
MASIELLYSDIEQLLLSVGASGIRRLTQNIQGHIMATSHWRAVMRYPGQESVQLIEGVKSADGRLVVLSTWADLQQLQQMPGERMTMATNLQDVTPMTVVGILASAEYTQMGGCSALDNSCQHTVLRLLARLHVAVPPTLVTLR